MAKKDLEEAWKLYPEDKDLQKYKRLTQEDEEMEERLKKILSNAESLKGKDYIDFIIPVLQQNPTATLSEEDLKKLKDSLFTDKELPLYFNAKGGVKALVHALEANIQALDTVQKLVETD